tara:strand:- start:987 stop:2150 length:1164 start_codon:yes stop_codon:yes gene_type:complete
MGLRKIFDKLGDALMPKELAPYAGTLASIFAPQLGLPLALAAGQLGSAKMNSGKLDPYTALATAGSYYGGGGQEIRASGGNLTQRLTGGLGSFNNPNVSFMEGFNTLKPVEGTGRLDRILGTSGRTNAGQVFDQSVLDNQADLDSAKLQYKTDLADPTITSKDAMSTYKQSVKDATAITDNRALTTKAGDIFKSGSEALMPNVFGEVGPDGKIIPGSFDFLKASQTIASAATLSNVMNIAEELKKQKMKDKAEEQKVYRAWFEQYERVTGSPYSESPYPESYLTEKFNEIYNATGGRIGYNLGGSTGIIAAAPGMPTGMQLDGRDGMFISQGVEEKADDVPAMLSKNEFVLTADAMAGLDKMNGGSGDPRAAAKEMYRIMDQLEAMA